MSNKYKHGKYRISIAGDKKIQNKVVSITDNEGNDALGGGGGSGGASSPTIIAIDSIENLTDAQLASLKAGDIVKESAQGFGPTGDPLNGTAYTVTNKGDDYCMLVSMNDDTTFYSAEYVKSGGQWACTYKEYDIRKHFKGWWPDLATLKAAHTAEEGDSAYVKDASPATTWSIYIYDATATSDNFWADSGTDADTTYMQTFADGQEVNEVHIVNNLKTGGTEDVLSAEQGKVIAETTMEQVIGNILSADMIIEGKKITHAGVMNDITSYYSGYTYGATDFIKIPEEGLILNHGVNKKETGISGFAVYSSPNETDFIEAFAANVNPVSETNEGVAVVDPSGHQNWKYVRFSLFKPSEPYNGVSDGYAIFNGTELPVPQFVPYAPPTWKMKKQPIEDGEIATNKLADNAVTTDKIKDESVTIDKMHDTQLEYTSSNLCNPDDCVFPPETTPYPYISGIDGTVSNAYTGVAKGYTGFIPFDKNGLYCNKTIASNNIGYAFYRRADDLEGSFVRGYCPNNTYNPQGCTNDYAAWSEDVAEAKYVRFTIQSADSSNLMVNKGNSELPYEPYATPKRVISSEILPKSSDESDANTYLDGVNVILPNEIVVTKGDNLQVFFKACVDCYDFNVFSINAICKKVGASSFYGKSYTRYFELDTTNNSISTGDSFALEIDVVDNARRIVASGTTTIRVIATMSQPSSQKNILMVGASTLDGLGLTTEVYRRLCTDTGNGTFLEPTGINLSNISFVGRKKPAPSTYPDVYQEQNSGRGWYWYATSGGDSIYRFFANSGEAITGIAEGDVYTQGGLTFTITNDINTTTGIFSANGTGAPSASGTLTRQSGSGAASIDYTTVEVGANPFWSNNGLDFASYASLYCNNQIDLMVCCLAGNDIYGDGGNRLYKFDDVKETYIKPFLNALHTQMPSTKVILYTPPLLAPKYIPSPADNKRNYYRTMVSRFWKYAKGYEALLEEEYSDGHTYSEFVSVSATLYEFDNENLYEKTQKDVCNRLSEKESFDRDNLHYTIAGKNTVADTLYHVINDVLS